MAASSSNPLLLEHLKMRALPRNDGCRAHTTYETLLAPMPIAKSTSGYAFGGLSIALVIQAAFHTLQNANAVADDDDDGWVLYSLFGRFLGSVSTVAPVRLEVETMRSTRSFQTHSVRLFAAQKKAGTKDGGEERLEYGLRFFSTLDFCRATPHARHPMTDDVLHFSNASDRPVHALQGGPETFQDWRSVAKAKRQTGQADDGAMDNFYTVMEKRAEIVEIRLEPQSLIAETMSATLPTTAEALRQRDCFPDASVMRERIWQRPVVPLLPLIRSSASASSDGDVLLGSARSIACAQIAFNLDPRVIGSLSVANHMPYGVAHTSVSLDIAIRFHTEDADVDAWHLYETQVKEEGHGRFYGETRCLNRQGNNVATATQQAAYRPVVRQKSAEQKRSRRQSSTGVGRQGTMYGKTAKL